MPRKKKHKRITNAPRRTYTPSLNVPPLSADTLRLWRIQKNVTNPVWTQAYTAEWLGVSERNYRRWENSEVPIPQHICRRIYEYEDMRLIIASLEEKLLESIRQ